MGYTRLLSTLVIAQCALWILACSTSAFRSDGADVQTFRDAVVDGPFVREYEHIRAEPLLEAIDPESAAQRVATRLPDSGEREEEDDEGVENSHWVAAKGLWDRSDLRLPDVDIFFPYDSAVLNDEAMSLLDIDADWLHRHRDLALHIEGHCDERGSAAYNLVLGEKRALAVRQYLMEHGIPEHRLTAMSYGETRPLCLGRSEPCHQENRRSHLVVTP